METRTVHREIWIEMAPAEEATGIANDKRSRSYPKLLEYHNPTHDNVRLEAKDNERTDYHLYFMASDIPKQMDWVFYPKYKHPVRRYEGGKIPNTPFKIVASTDKSLGLPMVSIAFKRHFCSCNGLQKVSIVFEQEYSTGVTDGGRERTFYGDWKPKVDKEGNVVFILPQPTMKDILHKHPHLRGEFDDLIYSAMKHAAYTPAYKLTEWKSENGFVWS